MHDAHTGKIPSMLSRMMQLDKSLSIFCQMTDGSATLGQAGVAPWQLGQVGSHTASHRSYKANFSILSRLSRALLFILSKGNNNPRCQIGKAPQSRRDRRPTT